MNNTKGNKAMKEYLTKVEKEVGDSLAAVDSTGFSDPYLIFTCNGKTKTSSIKFQKLDPQWNEVFEFVVVAFHLWDGSSKETA
ncbi:hypothetical protein IFM89_032205 [Coptis chinensis]|uniref:C2 domain-containing protein n=1 Tax=Coptis chinensis TaxID=261450 RepID=A0A835LXS2_9MAGN|nr:hypothetical protein IFM89_032205 [Coptis chinensis]